MSSGEAERADKIHFQMGRNWPQRCCVVSENAPVEGRSYNFEASNLTLDKPRRFTHFARGNTTCLVTLAPASKREMTREGSLATWTPPLRAYQIARVQRAKTLVSYLLLFFGLRARYRSRNLRWSPSRESRHFSCSSRVAVTDNRTGSWYPQTLSLDLHTRRSLYSPPCS